MHKKCAQISEKQYKSIKNQETEYLFDCKKCNHMEEMPFFGEEYLEETPPKLDYEFTEDVADFTDFNVFKQSGLHFIHLNINTILPKIDELRLLALRSNAAVIGISESKIDE